MLRRRTSPLSMLLAALAALTVLVPLVPASTATAAPGAPVAAAPAPRTGVDVGRPANDSCHDLTLEETARRSDPDPAVSCDGRYTSRTHVVRTVPNRISMTNTKQLSRFVDRQCSDPYRKLTSTRDEKRLLAATGSVWFTPTRGQISRGARWIRCDVVVYGGRALTPITRWQKPLLRALPLHDSLARCMLGARQQYRVTACIRPHQFRAKGTYVLKGKRYPGPKARARQHARQCPLFTGPTWVAFPPSEEAFEAGFKRVICTVKTRR
ncbi:MAG: hypothetical protein CMH83_20600 [Nocardioides sp.]|nr:hypothetical protein [Nocardioides sp.]